MSENNYLEVEEEEKEEEDESFEADSAEVLLMLEKVRLY